jgi:hypothetical protein
VEFCSLPAFDIVSGFLYTFPSFVAVLSSPRYSIPPRSGSQYFVYKTDYFTTYLEVTAPNCVEHSTVHI